MVASSASGCARSSFCRCMRMPSDISSSTWRDFSSGGVAMARAMRSARSGSMTDSIAEMAALPQLHADVVVGTPLFVRPLSTTNRLTYSRTDPGGHLWQRPRPNAMRDR